MASGSSRGLRFWRRTMLSLGMAAVAVGVAGAASAGAKSSTVNIEGHAINVGNGKLKIALFLNGTNDAYALALEHGAQAEAKKLGVSLTVLDGADNVQTQTDQMQQALTQGYNAWGFQAVSQSTCSLVKKAISKGILISVFNEQICTSAEASGLKAYLPGTLNFIAGDETPTAFTDWLDKVKDANPGPQDVLLVVGIPGLTQTIATEAAAAKIEKSDPQFKITTLQIADYGLPGAHTAVQARLNADKKVTIIAGNYSDMTQGAVLAATQAKLKVGGAHGIKVYDMGASSWAINAVKNGTVQLTAPFLPYTETQLAVQSLYNAWHGKGIGKRYVDVLATLKGSPFITKANVGSFKAEY
jgi:ribose transport system substrate-binding protein